MEQRVVYVEKTRSQAMSGDQATGEGHDVLPALLRQGFVVDSIAPVGESAAYFVVVRQSPPPGKAILTRVRNKGD
jgi:hypothetical protein